VKSQDVMAQVGKTLKFLEACDRRDRWPDPGEVLQLALENQIAIMSELGRRRRAGPRWDDRGRSAKTATDHVGTKKRS
jgi:hypothetical protein